jgi:hypothetical protein
MPEKKKTPRRNLGQNLWEFHGEDINYGYPECTKYTQEISSHQK